jgi:putative nucleotidyltransferase with HDIG domain
MGQNGFPAISSASHALQRTRGRYAALRLKSTQSLCTRPKWPPLAMFAPAHLGLRRQFDDDREQRLCAGSDQGRWHGGCSPQRVASLQSSAAAPRRRAWDEPSRSPALEKFYRELMGVEKLPSAPEIARRTLATVNRDKASLQDLATLIARDQALAARLLRLANGAFFAVRGKVTSIAQAVTLLGFERVRDLVLSLSVWGALEGTSATARRFRKRLWVHSSMVAAAARMLAERTNRDEASAFTAGLLHDVGKLVLGLRLGDTYWELLEDAITDGGAAEAERAALSCDHATVGGWLLQLWGMPPDLVEAVALHTDPLVTDQGLDTTTIIAVADRLLHATDANGSARDDVLDELRTAVPGVVEADAWREIWAALFKEQQSLSSVFD